LTLRCGRFELSLERPLVMGVVNVTPDSFSDGGKYLDPEAAISHARRMIDEGVDLLDVGGESTRPGAAPVSEEEECVGGYATAAGDAVCARRWRLDDQRHPGAAGVRRDRSSSAKRLRRLPHAYARNA
jgi:hypothetical protein